MKIKKMIRREIGKKKASRPQDMLIAGLLLRHFGRLTAEDLSIAERVFPFRVRADLQKAVERVLGDGEVKVRRFCGVHQPHSWEGIEFSVLMVQANHQPPVAVPAQYEEVDIGEEAPIRCLKVGLWLLEGHGARYAVLLSPAMKHGQSIGVRFQIAAPNDARGVRITEQFFRSLETAVNDCRSYRGKILSLEEGRNYSGQATGIKVHRLRTVARDQVILPDKTLALLERNVIQFVQNRGKLSALGQATKKGILFYGPPGTGKSHTIHFLAGALTGHTMLLITAEQVGLLAEYMALARLLQPSVVVIEDVDLIARDRESMNSPCAEATLNLLLNEMDGLKEAADILFILTTNRPQALEAALASRPGRVDQAIEFPLPDDAGREKLVRLYGRGAELSDEVVRLIVGRTEKVSAAFIKELIRRSVQFQIERAGAERIETVDVENALDEMLFSGGSLNVKLLGGT
ncbi:MAG TPA: ATP-binding protein [Tepidisphaeraceae bacterium]